MRSMTREEAAARTEGVVRCLKEQGWDAFHQTSLDIQALDMAIAALRGPTREMVERMRGCSDCQRKTCVSCRRFGWAPQRCVDCNDQDKWSPWNFCPVCGKPLTGEAVDMMVRRWREVVDDETN